MNDSLYYNEDYYPNKIYNDIKDSFYCKINESFDEFNAVTVACANAYVDYIKTGKVYLVKEDFEELKDKAGNILRKIRRWLVRFINDAYDYYFKKAFDKFDECLDINRKIFKEKLEEGIEPFTATGFTYTIGKWDVRTKYLRDTLSEYTALRDKVTKISKNAFINMMDKYNDDFFDKIRGKMVKLKRCSILDFPNELIKKYRNKTTVAKPINVDSEKLAEYLEKYKEYRLYFDDMRKDILPAINGMFDYIEDVFEHKEDIVDTEGNRIQFKDITYSNYVLSVRDEHRVTDVDDENILRYSIYYAKENKIIYKVLNIVVQNLVAKINAIVEALTYYRKCIIRGFKLRQFMKTKKEVNVDSETVHIDSDYPFTETYSQMLSEMIIGCQDDFTQIELQAAYEAAAILIHNKKYSIVTEDGVDVVDRGSSGIVKMLVHIVETIRRLIARFIQEAGDLFSNNQKWFDENAYKFDNISDNVYERINITILPYNSNECITRLNESVNVVVDKSINDGYLGTDLLDSEEKFYKWAAPKLYTLDPENSQRAALKYYRGGSNEVVSIRGSTQVKSLCNNMLKYCREYDKLTRKIKSNAEAITKEIDELQKKIAKDAGDAANEIAKIKSEAEKKEQKETKEELNEAKKQSQENNKQNNANNNNNAKTEANYKYYLRHATFDIVMEADEPKNGGVKVEGENNANTSETQKKIDKVNTSAAAKKKLTTQQMGLFKLKQRVLGAQLTVAEEKYKKYIQVLKDVLNSGLKTPDSDKNARQSSKNTPDKVNKDNTPAGEKKAKKVGILGKMSNKVKGWWHS